MRCLHLGNWISPLMKSINMIWSWVNIPQIKLSEQMPENWQHVAGSQNEKKKKERKKLSYCQPTVLTEWKDRIMCKEYFGEWWWKDTIKICFSNVGFNIWECWDFQSMQKFSMELVNWYLLKESISQRNSFSSIACYWWSSLL